MGGRLHLRLNNGERPIANKYREGKMKRTLKRELKVREIVERETLEASRVGGISTRSERRRRVGQGKTVGVAFESSSACTIPHGRPASVSGAAQRSG